VAEFRQHGEVRLARAQVLCHVTRRQCDAPSEVEIVVIADTLRPRRRKRDVRQTGRIDAADDLTEIILDRIVVLVTAAAGAKSTRATATTITGAGATFPFPIYSKWADAYKKETGIGLNYQSIGSGAGIKQIQAKKVAFGATDAPLNIDQLKKMSSLPAVPGNPNSTPLFKQV
jgi:hypothetical protein